MLNLLKKEMKLAASPITYFFIAFGLMTLIPGYPILLGAFFCSLGMFQSYQRAREANDIVYTALLPVRKTDTVKAKYIFAFFIEMCTFLIMVILTLVRMTALRDASPYVNNALMTANFVFLGFALVIFGLFNSVYIGGFFTTAYNFTKPFILFIIAAFLTVGVAEALHHFPGLEGLNSLSFENMGMQLAVFAFGIVFFVSATLLSMRKSEKNFEIIDL